jgi:hypothetical protein
VIRNLKDVAVDNFNGKNLNVALQAMDSKDLLQATNIQILGDGALSRVPGYTVVNSAVGGSVLSIYDFQRAVDHKQFIFVQAGGNLWAMQADGSGLQKIVTGISTSVKAAYVKNAFICYVSDGTNSWRIVDNQGTLTAYQWGMTPPATAPAIEVTGSALFSLQYGRQYVYCYVSEITDSLGIVRTSVSAPSPMSPFTGPVTNQQMDVSSIEGSGDPQCNKIWVFATYDAAQATQSTFYFAAEIANPGSGQASVFTDTLTDDELDDTRQAPFNINNPPPACAILNQFQNRIWAATPSFIQYSAYEEALLGIPEECWPPQNFIPVPSGSKLPTAMITHDSGTSMLACSIESCMQISGYDSTTISAQDRVLSPGAAGKHLVVQTPTYLFWVGTDKRLWAWNGVVSITSDIPAEAKDFGYPLGKSQPGTFSLNDINDAQLANAELKYFSYEEQHYVALFANTDGTGNLNVAFLWEVVMINGAISNIIPTDKLPSDPITSVANVFVGSTPYLFLGTANGQIMRWPDGYVDAGKNISSVFSTAWIGSDTKCQWMYADILVDNPSLFIKSAQVSGIALDLPDMNRKPSLLQINPYPVAGGNGSNIVRVNLRSKPTSQGKYIRLLITLPSDSLNHTVSGIRIYARPLFTGQQ